MACAEKERDQTIAERDEAIESFNGAHKAHVDTRARYREDEP
jgi:hypothetical protein